MKRIITISREFGAGGGSIGSAVAKKLGFEYYDKEIILNQGDSIYFNPTHRHGQRCVGDQKAKFITVIAE